MSPRTSAGDSQRPLGGEGGDRRRSHRFLEHTGELRLELRAESLAGLIEEAGRALGILLRDGDQGQGRTPAATTVRTVEIASRDREALLVDWLNELLYLAETELWVPVSIEVSEIRDTQLRATVRGAPVPEARSQVKAATLHGIAVRQAGDGLAAEVVLDV